MPEISVILPVRNGARTIHAAVRSCLEQTWRDLEVVAIDDASEDSTLAFLQAAAAEDARLRVVSSSRHLGVAEAFQLGLQASRGTLVARMDADDINEPQRLELQRAALLAQPDLAGVSCLVRIRKWREDELHPPDAGYARFECWLNSVRTPEALAAQRFIDMLTELCCCCQGHFSSLQEYQYCQSRTRTHLGRACR